MSATTTYKCDFCGAVQADTTQFWQVRLVIHVFSSFPSIYDQGKMHKDACRSCMEKYGLLVNATPEVKPIQPEPTLEDMIRMIVKEEIEQSA